ncbi:MAG: methylmalonyl Co-A mutase-associated GTPase MeaB [Bacteroidales bacterium]|nr:methylmalonyl Co-A mutase-associated GTPase MeaB [Bacteroidales bacterium]
MKQKTKSSLSVKQGVKNINSLDKKSVSEFKKAKKKEMPTEFYVEGIKIGDITILSRAITLVESAKKEHQLKAQEIITQCMPLSGNSVRIGITGVPGAGKSTFIETFGMQLIEKGKKIAVLAIDPSSQRSGGSILGDKTRMEKLSAEKNAFIRPSPSAGSLGGVARKTAETIILCEAAGFDTIFIETVGVGQSETAVHSMVDFFLLLKLAGAGDELQGIKRGIIEMADAIVINKADGANEKDAKLAKSAFNRALHLYPLKESSWQPKVTTCSAFYNKGIDTVWKIIKTYLKLVKENGFFEKNRSKQNEFWLYETINQRLEDHFYKNENIQENLLKEIDLLSKNKTTPFEIAEKLLKEYFAAN